MSTSDLLATLSSHYAPLLPTTQSLVWARHLLWSVVMAAVGMGLVPYLLRLRRWSRHLPWVLALWAWVPGPWGAGYWLGLAFQIPSLSAAFLALSFLIHRTVHLPPAFIAPDGSKNHWTAAWALMAAVTGAFLLLDTFAVFDFSMYQWGFSPLAFALALVVALLPWVISGKQGLGQAPVWALLASLAVFVLTRWPTGNMWDAVLDPWLWLFALVYLLRTPWRRG